MQLCGGIAPPEGGQARVGKTPEVVNFLQVVRPVPWKKVRHTHGVGGGGMHW